MKGFTERLTIELNNLLPNETFKLITVNKPELLPWKGAALYASYINNVK